MNQATDATGYGFGIGRLRSLETGLLDRSRYERLVRQPDPAGLATVLADTRYGPLFEEAGGIEPGLHRASEENFGFLALYCRDEWVLDAFRLTADVHNLKIFVKARLQEREVADDELLGFGAWDRDTLAALAAAEPKSGPERFRRAVAKAVEAWLEDKDPARVDLALDRAAQAALVEACAGNEFLAGLFALRADTENLRSLVRVRALEEERQVLEEALLPGGRLKPAELAALLGEDDAQLVQRFRLTDFGRLVEEGLGWLREKKSLARFERLAREMELRLLLKARFITFGFEPLAAFYLVRENEIGNLRRLLAAKTAGLAEEESRELVSHVE